jgi:hypothetical protein
MTALLFDSITLLRHGIRLADGGEHSFDELGLDEHETLRLHARELVLVGTPRRSMEVAADRVVVAAPEFVLTRPDTAGGRTRLVAQQIDGHLRIDASLDPLLAGTAQGCGGITLWYVSASPPPTVEGCAPGVEVTRMSDPYELWTRWQDSLAHAVSDVTAVGADLL